MEISFSSFLASRVVIFENSIYNRSYKRKHQLRMSVVQPAFGLNLDLSFMRGELVAGINRLAA